MSVLKIDPALWVETRLAQPECQAAEIDRVRQVA
jgi:hypothetical protein